MGSEALCRASGRNCYYGEFIIDRSGEAAVHVIDARLNVTSYVRRSGTRERESQLFPAYPRLKGKLES